MAQPVFILLLLTPISKRVFGYSGFWLIGEEAHITTLAVHPDHQRQYIGERLLINNILQARKLGARWLTLRSARF